ncbi:MAG: hypothetical protein ABUL42_04015 [Terricaulis silvestris]
MAEPLNATFFALQRRKRGGVLITTTLAYGVLTALVAAAFFGVTWRSFVSIATIFRQAASGQSPDPSAFLSIFGILGWVLPFLFVYFVLRAAYEAACLRWMISEETSGLFGLSLNAETWRVYSGYWMWFLIQLGLSWAIGIVTMPLLLTFGLSAARSGADLYSSQFQIVQLIVSLLQYPPLIFFAIKFAPGNATSVLRRKFSYFSAWKVTNGRFWALFGAFATLGVIWFVVGAALMGVVGAGFWIRSWPALLQAFTAATPAERLTAYVSLFTAENMIWFASFYAIQLLTSLVFSLLSIGVSARAALAAVEDGKIDGITPGVAKAFE